MVAHSHLLTPHWWGSGAGVGGQPMATLLGELPGLGQIKGAEQSLHYIPSEAVCVPILLLN